MRFVCNCKSWIYLNQLPVLSWVIDDTFCMEEGFVPLTADPAGGIYSGTGTAGDPICYFTCRVGGPYTHTAYAPPPPPPPPPKV